MLSDKKTLKIANICYANVAGTFAMFTNPSRRGPNFTWDWFISHCEESAQDWMFVYHVRGHKESVNQLAKTFAREIAEHLVMRMEG